MRVEIDSSMNVAIWQLPGKTIEFKLDILKLDT